MKVLLSGNTCIDDTNQCFEKDLVNLLMGIGQPTVSEIERLTDHLVECLHCQNILEKVLAQIEEHSDDDLKKSIEVLQAQLTKITHEVRYHVDMSEYLEALEIYGESVAQTLFPLLTAHLERCAFCRLEVDVTKVLLRQAEADGLITPLR